MSFRTPIVGTGTGGGGGGGAVNRVVDTVAGITTGTAGQCVYFSGADIVSQCNNQDLAKSRFFGIILDVPDLTVVTWGRYVLAQFVTDAGAPVFGQPVFLAGALNDAGAGLGKLTPTPPSTSGSKIFQVGICINAGAWAGSKTAIVHIQPAPTVIEVP